MSTRPKSLRWAIEKWLGPTSTTPVRVKRFCWERPDQIRYIGVKASQSMGSLTIMFFRHDDGSWFVFPPDSRHPVMRAEPIQV